jgi:hypothetical protein
MYAAIAVPVAAEREEGWGPGTRERESRDQPPVTSTGAAGAQPAHASGSSQAARAPAESRGRWSHAAPEVDLSVVPPELLERVRAGEREADVCEAMLVDSARIRGSLDVAIAEGLHALRQKDRLAQLGFHLDDYGREVLDLGKSATRNLARLGSALRERPILRDALRSGRVGLRAAETVLAVAKGEAEAAWVERAARCTVRELEEAVRRVKAGEDVDDEWFRIATHLPDGIRAVLDAALDVARRVDAGANRWDQLEAMAQEYLAEFGADAPDDDARALRNVCSRVRPGRDDPARRATLEAETDRWAMLPPANEVPAPEITFDDAASATEIDVRLRKLAAERARWEGLIGWCAHVVRRSGMTTMLGFSNFRHYVEERLMLSPRAVEQREQLEKHVRASPALRDARRKKVSYEKLRILARLPEGEIASWIPRAKALTCIALRRLVEGERERQMRGAKKLSIAMPRRIAVVVAVAVASVRKRVGRLLPLWDCLAIVAGHFLQTWKDAVRPPRTRSQKVRERDGGMCQVPGCSHAADHAHHVEFRSHGGGHELPNQVAVCEFHHQRCIHGGYLQVTGEAPHKLTWWLGGKRWNGGAPVLAVCG